MDRFMSWALLAYLKVTKFGTHVGLNMLINISCEFYHNRQKKIFGEIFMRFPTSHIENHL